jgi:hypothetical protein
LATGAGKALGFIGAAGACILAARPAFASSAFLADLGLRALSAIVLAPL